jgi:hypothetical protein
MNKTWLFLRGECKNSKEVRETSIEKSDMWENLFNELSEDGLIWLNDNEFMDNEFHLTRSIDDKNYPCKFDTFVSSPQKFLMYMSQPDIIFARGAHKSYLPILKKFKDSYIIRYGSGQRYIPEPDIVYNLILCDSEKQKKEIISKTKYTENEVKLLIKPAAWHFKPIECKKEYDVCFIANETQGHFKGVQWVYDTVPKDLKVLHLGNFTGRYTAPSNVIRKHVARIDMPSEISKCKVGIVPYWNQIDSCPRVIPEMLACGLPLVVADELNFWSNKYPSMPSNKDNFWRYTERLTVLSNEQTQKERVDFYQENLSIPVAVKHIRGFINEYKSI